MQRIHGHWQGFLGKGRMSPTACHSARIKLLRADPRKTKESPGVIERKGYHSSCAFVQTYDAVPVDKSSQQEMNGEHDQYLQQAPTARTK
jgi:hypothetical protein